MKPILTALLLALPLLAACSQKQGEVQAVGAASAPLKSPRAPQGAMLAYEHHVSVSLDRDDIPPRLKAVQAACDQRRFGQCTVLDMSEQGGDYASASITVRVVPDGVEPLIELAGKGGEIGSRNTHAEDLAEVVRDNDSLRARLENERTQLQAFQQRRDLAVADMIALSRQLAEVEAQLQEAQQAAAQHRMRIETQKLTIRFGPPEGQSGRNEIAQAVRDFGGTLAMGTAWTIRAAAFLIPVVIVLGFALWAFRRLRRSRRSA